MEYPDMDMAPLSNAAPEGEDTESNAAPEDVDSAADEDYPYLDSLGNEEDGEDLPELVQRMSPEEKLEKIEARLDLAEHQCQLPSGMINLFEDLRNILGN